MLRGFRLQAQWAQEFAGHASISPLKRGFYKMGEGGTPAALSIVGNAVRRRSIRKIPNWRPNATIRRHSEELLVRKLAFAVLLSFAVVALAQNQDFSKVEIKVT